MNWPPFPATESSLGFKRFYLPVTGVKSYQKYGRWEGDICRSRREKGSCAVESGGADPGRTRISETSAPEIFCSSSEAGTRPATKSTMKAINVQLPVRLTKRVFLPGAGPPRAAGYPKLLIKGNGGRGWYAFFRSLRAVLSGVLDSTPYDQISSGREVSVVFTSQGPVIYRYGRNSAVDSAPATQETNRTARFPERS